MQNAFYVVHGDHYVATQYTRGPWHPDFQHGGPPSALLAHALETRADGMQIVRINVDLLKAVPISSLSITVEERTGGKRRRVLEAQMYDVITGALVARAQALLLRRASVETGPLPMNDPPPPLPPDQSEPFSFSLFDDEISFRSATELRRASGIHLGGKSQVWLRQRIPLIEGLETSALQRLMVAADCGNGVSVVLSIKDYNFSNPDLNLTIRRYPQGEWLCLDAMSHFQDCGMGVAESRIWDAHGVVACASQNLLLEAKSPTM